MKPPDTRHGFLVAPPVSVSSPHVVDARPDEDVPWWTPSWGDIARHLGWRWIYVVPAAAVLLSLGLLPLFPGYLQFVGVFWKPLLIIVALPTAAAMKSIKSIVQNRKDPFCIHCGYTLIGLPDRHRCPECGRQFCLATIEEYRRDPHWFAKRWKLMHSAPMQQLAFDAGAVRSKRSRDGT